MNACCQTTWYDSEMQLEYPYPYICMQLQSLDKLMSLGRALPYISTDTPHPLDLTIQFN